MSPPGRPYGHVQSADVINENARSPIRERHGEKERAARDEIPPVSDHVPRISRISLHSIRATASDVARR